MEYYQKLIKSILTDDNFKITQVSNIEIVKALPSYHTYFNEIVSLLQNGNYKTLNELKDNSKSFDDIAVIKFMGNNNQEFYGIVYDDWELWTDPIVTKVIRKMPI